MSFLATLKSSNEKTAKDFLIDNDVTSIKIGRNPTSSIIVDNIRCSVNHCEISILRSEDGSPSFLVLDNSSNGTFINNCKLGRGISKQIRNGDTVTILGKDVVGEEEFIEFTLECTPIKRAEGPESLPQPMKKSKMDNQLSEEISCLICLEIVHQPVSLIPCLHNFCGGCFSDWCQRSLECPNCRVMATMVKKNHLLANLANIYLESHPNDKRPEEELKDLEEKNAFLQDITELNNKKEKCRQCDVPLSGFQCSPLQKHIACSKCFQMMPIRNDRPQSCGVCKEYFCNMYWTAPPLCFTGINLITAYSNGFFASIPNYAFNENQFEQNVLKEYLKRKRIPIKQLGIRIINIMQNERWEFMIAGKKVNGLNAHSFVCNECALVLWSEMLYMFRVSIQDELPNYVKKRDDCRYGRECRTQRNNLTHAQKLNHICERTDGANR